MRCFLFFLLGTLALLAGSLHSVAALHGFSATATGSTISVPWGSWFFNNWKTTTTGIPSTYFNDGNFNPSNGLYHIPVAGLYSFTANVFLEASNGYYEVANQNIDLRLIQCTATSCSSAPNTLGSCIQGVGNHLTQQANTWLNDFSLGYHGPNPAYNPNLIFTGYLPAGVYIGLCIENWSTSVDLNLMFPEVGITTFSGYLISS